ncbi:flavodoxin family protein [Couchioplanes azureus]|uniref:flavodoxin family protein n=1 Tax=Couchioplanes caeruleus TaxID=56438 RepID=UPI0016700661|nr:flavodoxin domain-containing protein [Couchioplanes caeruleus]GGQ84621.1 flavodoxin [Couchioplanes caeruleus subsp. azureus]
MKALIIYESLFGNTEKVAEAIADGLRESYEVTVADVAGMPRASGVDLLVVGGPTHAFGMTRPATRRQAGQQGDVRPGAVTAGLREYFDSAPSLHGVPAAAFDTKVNKPLLPGSAARAAQRRLRGLGCRILMPAEHFLVTGTPGPLAPGEEDRARRWGAGLAAVAATGKHRV